MSNDGKLPCRICGEPLDGDEFPYCHYLGICGECACAAANLYWKKHAGQYLTWPNPPVAKRDSRKPMSARKKLAVWKRDNFQCVICRSGEDLTVDHIVPVSKGGSDDMDNLRTLCQSHNSKKGNREE